MSDEERRSGSRWEPEQPDQSWSPQPSPADQPTELQAAPHAAEVDSGSVAVAEAERPAWTPPYLPPTTASADTPRPSRRRRAIAAAIGAALLLVGGGAGYAIGHATAATSGPAGTFGHRHGGPGGFRDGQDDGPGSGLGGTAGGGAGAGTGNTGSGGTGTGSST